MRRLAAAIALLAWSAAACPEGPGGYGDWFYLVKSKPSDPAREAEYNAWYDDIDIPDVLEVPGFMRARRAVAVTLPGSDGGAASEPKARYAAVYDIESGDIDKTIIDLYVAARKMSALGRLTDVLKVVEANYYRKIGGRGSGSNDHENYYLYTQKILCCESEAERKRFAAWYDERGAAAVARIDGFRKSGLYELYRIMEVLTVPEEEIPHFLVVHEFAGISAGEIAPRLRDAIEQLESAGRLDDGYQPGESVLYRLMSDVRSD